MKNLIALILSIFSSLVFAAASIDTPAFKLKLSGDWKQEGSTGPQRYSYYSSESDIGLTCSYELMDAKPEDTKRIAEKLTEFRLEAEAAAARAFDVKMTIVEPLLVPFSKGHQVAYYGDDNNHRQFRYLGLVFPTKTVNIYVESKTMTQAELEEAFNQLLKGLTFD